MATIQTQITIQTSGRDSYNITHEIERAIHESGVETGLCHVFIHHTSASLIITENADPDVRIDIETLMQRIAPDGDPEYRHVLEGTDDMSGHMRTILTATELTIPITHGRSGLGTWQGLFLWEHRTARFSRKITITIIGD